MSDEGALLNAICAAPADDTLRLVFADFLQEHGGYVESAWATFIRAHVRLVTDTAAAGDIPSVRRYGGEKWLKRFAGRLGVPVATGVRYDGWERGFPSYLSGGYPALRPEWAAVLTRVPFQRLRVEGIEDEAVEDLVLWPNLDRLTALDLTTADDVWVPRTLSARGIAALAGCAALAGLEELSLSFLEVTERVADLVLRSPHLLGLKRLALRAYAAQRPPSDRARVHLRARFGAGVELKWGAQ